MSRSQFEPYRPSNGTEGEYFMNEYCYRCAKDDPEKDILCPIIIASMGYDIEDEGYPSDTWVYFNEKPTCLAFRERGGDDGPEPVDPRQLDLFLPVIESLEV